MPRHCKLLVALPLIAVCSTFLQACHSSARSSESPAPIALIPTKKWEFSTGRPANQCKGCYYQEQIPAIDSDGTIYAGGARGLYALAPDGKQRWYYENVYQPNGIAIHFVVIDDNENIWFDAASTIPGSGSVIRVDAEGHDEGGMGLTGPVTQIGEAYDGTIVASGTVIDINGKVAQPKVWRVGGDFFSFIPDGGAYSTRGNLIAQSPDHNVAWIKNILAAGEPVLASDGTIYVGGSGALSAVNSDGTGKWSFPIPNHIAMSPSVANDGTIYFGCDDNNVYALTPDGHLKWKFSTGGAVRSTPAIAKNGSVYFGSLDNKLYAVGADGNLKWAFTTGGQVFSPAIADDGTIYVQTGEEKLYAIQDPEDNGGLSGQWPKRGAGLRNTSRGVR
ncbi:MAG: PQQ-binding-like beta-propeller repeat protein [Candidatus Acidiferrales bacterium]